MRKAVIITAIIAVITLLCTIGFGIAAVASGVPVALEKIDGHIGNLDIGNIISGAINTVDDNINFSAGNTETKQINLSAVDTIEISVDAAKVEITQTTGDTAVVTIKTVNEIGNRRTFKAETVGNTAIIESSYHFTGVNLLSVGRTRVNIQLPAKEYKKIALKLDAGDLTISDSVAKNISVTLNAGNVNLKNITGGDFDIECDAGNINLNDTKGKDFVIRSDAGNIQLRNVIGSKLNITNSAGNVETDNDCRFTDKIDATVNMGNITLRLPTDIGFILEYDVDMGTLSNHLHGGEIESVNNNGPVSKSGTLKFKDESCKITLEADMGNITLN